MKLKHLLSLMFVLMSAVPLFLGLQYLNNHFGKYSREQYVEHLSAMSAIAEQRIQSAIERIRDNSALISSRTQLRLSLDQWTRTGEVRHRAKIAKIIHDAKQGLSHLREIRIYDAAGRLVVSTLEAEPQTAELQTKPEKIEVSLAANDGYTVAISREPLILDHTTVGYVEAQFFADFINALARDRTGLGETGEWLVAVRAENGDALFAVPLKYDSAAAFKRRVSKDRHDVPIIQAMLGNEIVLDHAPDYREEPVLASTRYLPELDWGLVAKVSEAEVNELVTRNQSLIYVAEFVIVLLAIAVGVVLAFYIARPIEKLRAYTALASKGSLEEPHLERAGWKEARDLADHFTFMIKALRELNENLQAQVAERTQALNEANKKLEKLASEDPLTGLYNRRLFDIRLSEEFDRATRYRHDLAAAMLDLDHFKKINDRFGHAAGDEVLSKVGSFLKASARASDVVARVGGEEFCLLLPEGSKSGAMAFLERIRAEIEALQFSTANGQFTVTCSIGLACLDSTTETEQTLIERADVALYQAKKTGRNRIVQSTQKASTVSEFPKTA
ncbi:sensor domain-containing diguanylate cyclase [Roseibium sediminicola]|uniref:diguanylate cyclase n=1 Tax=Roseibium sediminicola TaxID=2933272 RepID=A0ABT0H0B9_9HYPH|nr:sensor domain-containing diguanylate cyclase [Roseibium sp. CAU 1639]MCK7614533.1 diguanylate cyclase [Roseibium sp. CAU 1639]